MDSKMYDFSNSARIGPGTWYNWMLSAVKSDNKGERLYICKQIKQFCDNFKCGDCKPHAVKYVKLHPPENSSETNLSLFDWVVTFMNNVQKRIGKPVYNKELLLRQFLDNNFMVCSSGCGSSSTQENKPQSNKFTLVRHQMR